MSTPTYQSTPRPQVHEHRGERRRVLSHGPGGVTYDLPDSPHEPAQTISRGAWLEWTRPAAALDFDGSPLKGKRLPARPATHRDMKPGNVLTNRATSALYALRDYVHGEPHESLCQRSGLTHGSWQRAVGDLKRAGLVVVSIERQGRTVRACYSLTTEGARLASTLTQPTSRPTTQPSLSVGSVDAAHLGSVGCSSPSSSLLKPKAEEKKEERPTQPTLAAHDAAHAAQPTDAAALLAPILDTLRLLMEPIARMLEEQGKTQAALAATLERIAYALPGAPLAPCPCGSPREAKVNRTTGEHYVACLKGKACPTKQEARGEQPKASPMRVASARAAILAVDQRTKADIEAERRGIRPRPVAAS